MEPLVECVPNFSEGRDQKVIEAIARSIRESEGCKLLDVDAGASTNRTVYTFVGAPDQVVRGAMNAARTAYEHIDMAKHKGEHPRFGAMDVCPFVPVRGVSMEDSVEIARRFARMLAHELHVPVYLYGFAATDPSRKSLPDVRAGEYEKLPQRLQDPAWKPDFGPCEFQSSWGATAVGARKFLLAYNVNLMCTKEQATKIAFNIRTRGRGEGKRGRLECVQAIGWYLEEKNIAQVSTNITDLDVTSLHQVYDEVASDAKRYDLPVVGSEIVGLLPLRPFLLAAQHYQSRDRLMILDERSRVQFVRHRLGLDFLKPFDPDERIIEYAIRDDGVDFPVSSLPLRQFVREVAGRSEAPGGGAVAAAVASMGAALGCMVGQLSYGKKKWEGVEGVMRRNLPIVHGITHQLLPMVDRDCEAFNSFFQALKMPGGTEEEKKRKEEAKQAGIMKAIGCPLATMNTANSAWQAMEELARDGNINCISDIQVGAKCLHTGVWGAFQNVNINLPSVTDPSVREKLRAEAIAGMKSADDWLTKVLNIAESRQKNNDATE